MTDAKLSVDTWRVLGPRLADIFDTIESPLAVLTTDFDYVAVNSAYLAVTGRSTADLIGRNVFEVFPENPSIRDDRSPSSLRRSLTAVLAFGATDSMPLMRYDVLTDGEYEPRYWHVSNFPLFDDDGHVELVVNHPEEVTAFIDERLRLQADGEASTASSPTQTHAVDDVFTAAVTRLRNLNDLASSLVGAANPDEVGRAVMRDGLAMVGASAGSLILANGNRLDIVTSAGIAAATAAEWHSFTIEPGREPFSDVLATGEPLFFSNREAFDKRYPDHADATERSGHGAWAVLPLRTDDDVAGAIGVIFDQPNQFDTPVRLALYTLANLTAQAASRARLLAEQTTVLRSIEQAFEARLDPIDGVVTTHVYRAATVVASAGGDWYDLIDLGNGSTLIAIGDVANHGSVAVGEMARARSTVHTLALLGHEPDQIALAAANVLTELASSFTTAIVAILDQTTLELRWVTAGHPLPVLVAADGTSATLGTTSGPPLGSGFDHEYTVQTHTLCPGDTLVLYTDGLVEHPGESLDIGVDALRTVLGSADRAAPELAHHIVRELHPTRHQRDDVAIVTLHVATAANDDAVRPVS